MRLSTTFLSILFGLGVSNGAMAVEWDVSLWGKPRAFTAHVEKLAELVEARTEGDFRLKLSYGGLSENTKNLDGISRGAFEMAQFCVGYHPKKTPSLTVLELPFLGVSSLEAEIAVSQAVYDHPAVVSDLARWSAHLLMPSPLPQYNLVGVGAPPHGLYQLRGMDVRATGGIAKAIEVLKATPISMSATEVPDALANGTINGIAFAPHALLSFGILDKADWWTTNLNPGTVHCPVVVNRDALNALSPDHRAALLDSVDAALDHYVANYNGETMERFQQVIETKGITPVTFNGSALGLLREAAERVSIQPWLVDMREESIPGRALLDLVAETVADVTPGGDS